VNSDLVKQLLLAAVSTVATLFAAEAALRFAPSTWLGFEYLERRFEPPQEFEVHRSVNRFGSHDIEYRPKPPNVRRALLLGDSFVQGLAVPIEQTISRRLAHHLNRESPLRYDVVSLAGPGMSLAGERRLLERYGTELDPDLVVTVFYANDAMQALGRRRIKAILRDPALRRESNRLDSFSAQEADGLWIEGSVVNRIVSHRLTLSRRKREARGIPFPFMVYAVPPDALTLEAWGAARSTLLSTRAEAKRLAADYALVSVGSPFGVLGDEGLEKLVDSYPDMRERTWDLEEPDRVLAAFAREHGIPFLALQPLFREERQAGGAPLHWKYDGHWNAAGHERAAFHVAEFIHRLDEPRP
jgi:hypothetical protein